MDSAPKIRAKAKPTIFVRGFVGRDFEVSKREPMSVGRLIAKTRGHARGADDQVVNPNAALSDWLQVLSRYRAWDGARAAKSLMMEREQDLEAVGYDTTELRQRAKNFRMLRRHLDNELIACANQHGTLGTGGTEIDAMMAKLGELEMFVEQTLHPPPKGMGPKAKVVIAVRHVNDAVRSCTLRPGNKTEAPDLFCALAYYIVHVEPRFGSCAACKTLFIPKSAKRTTCSNRCRRRLLEQRRKRS